MRNRTVPALLTAIVAIACSSPTSPEPSNGWCIEKGDTIALLKVSAAGVITQCIYLTSEVQSCGLKAPFTYHAPACTVGAPRES